MLVGAEVRLMGMDERKSKVLHAIINDYVTTAEPVGSRTIARKYHLGVSPATIRNEMADLEELGYIEQPHTSAGRIPSDRGYRYFVDCLMETYEVTQSEQGRIRQAFERKVREIEILIQHTAKLLSETTNYASLVSGPQVREAVFQNLQLVPVGEGRALLVMVTDSGFVEDQVIELPVEITLMELQKISGVMNEKLRGKTLEQVGRGLLRELQSELIRYQALMDQTLAFLEEKMAAGGQERVYVGGASNILSQPEFRDISKVRKLIRALEQDKVVHDILDGPGGEHRVVISIGEEIRYREMQDCSLVSATYRVGDRIIGRIGVLGPKRMEYAKVVSIVESVTQRLSEAFLRK